MVLVLLGLESVSSIVIDPGSLLGICTSSRYSSFQKPLLIAISLPPQALISDDSSKGYDRFQVFNVNVDTKLTRTTFEVLAYASIHPYLDNADYSLANFGKFHSTRYPYQVWEPEDESVIVSVSQKYAHSVEIVGPHEPGFRFAINIDPVMFEVLLLHVVRWRSFSALCVFIYWSCDPYPDPLEFIESSPYSLP